MAEILPFSPEIEAAQMADFGPQPWGSPVHPEGIDFLKRYNRDEDKKKKALNYIVDRFDENKEAKRFYRNYWLEYYELYRMYSPYYENEPEWRSSYFHPLIFETIETQLPPLLGALFDTSPIMVAIASQERFMAASRQVEHLMDHRADQMGLFFTMYQIYKDMLIYGTSFAKTMYVSGDQYEGSYAESVDLMDIYPTGNATDVKSAREIVQRGVKHIDEIFQMAESKQITANKEMLKEIEKSDGYTYFSHIDRLRTLGYVTYENNYYDDYHEVLEFWGRFRCLKDEKFYDVVGTVIDRKFLVRLEENPYKLYDANTDYFYAVKPYIRFMDYPMPREFWGIGEAELLRSAQYEINDLRNAMGDAVQFNLYPMWQYVTGAIDRRDIPGGLIQVTPGGTVETRVPDGVKPLKTSMDWMAGGNRIAEIRQDARDATATHESQTGAATPTRDTATEVELKHFTGSQRNKLKNQLNQNNGIGPMFRQLALMELQFNDMPVSVRVMDGENIEAFLELTPSELKWDGAMKIQASSLYGHKGRTAQTRMQFAQLAAGLPFGEQVDWIELGKLIAQSLDIPDAAIILRQPEGAAAAAPAPGIPGGGEQPDYAVQSPTLAPSEDEVARLREANQNRGAGSELIAALQGSGI